MDLLVSPTFWRLMFILNIFFAGANSMSGSYFIAGFNALVALICLHNAYKLDKTVEEIRKKLNLDE